MCDFAAGVILPSKGLEVPRVLSSLKESWTTYRVSSNIKRFPFKPGLPQEFEILEIAKTFNGFRKELTTPHRTEFHHIFWIQEGNPVHLVDFNPVQLRPNTILFLKQGQVQCLDKKGGFDGKVILFTDSFFCQHESDREFLRSSILFNDLFTISQLSVPSQIEPFSGLFRQMEVELSMENDRFQADVLRNLLRNFLYQAERERRRQNFTEVKKGPDLDHVIQLNDLVEEQFRYQKQVRGFAEQMHITEKRLNGATSRVLGKTPKQVIDDRVVLEAKRLLAHTTSSVKQIGFELGFEEPTNFIKYFRKHYGGTPLECRARYTS